METSKASTARAARLPCKAGRQPRVAPTARTMVKASTTSTSDARKAAPTAGRTTCQDRVSMCCSSGLI
jgi:hypothetical protein